MKITALTISRQPYARTWPGLAAANLAGRDFRSAAEVRDAWFDSIELVQTPYFFWLDDDDSLPGNYLDVLAECVAADKDLAFTDERGANGKLYKSAEYSQAAHLNNFTLVHHLALCRTDAARKAIKALPVGHYWPEMLLYWQMAKAGAAYIPRVGYHWNRRGEGLHKQPFTPVAQMRSALWCKANP